ncbi:hypothetical protein [Streptomyces sp. HUAS TT7]|uniref:hypothetical protein n=1 Tax=Streptomyces sp. HUAS TT7 TaxID=3447507 RepID=UPI003F65EA44
MAEPSDAQRAAVRRAVRSLQKQELIEVQRRGVGRAYRQRRAHPRRTYPRYEYQLAPCPGPEQDCSGCTVGDVARFDFDRDVVELFLHHFGDLTEANRQLGRATLRGWHWYSEEQPRPDSDYRTYKVEITELCARRALTADEHAHAEQQLGEHLAPYVARRRAARGGKGESG